MTVKIKNLDGVNKTFGGVVIAPNVEYIASTVELKIFQKDANLINSLTLESPLALVNDLSGAEGVNELFSVGVHQLVENVVPEGGPKVYNKGFTFTVAANETEKSFYYQLPQSIKLASGFMIIEGGHIHDSITLELVHPTASPEIVLHQYTENYPAIKNGKTLIQNNAITEDDLGGLKIKMTYKSNSGTEVKGNCGLDGRLT